MPIGVVSGLQRETECLMASGIGSPRVLTFAGIGPERSAAGARQLISKGIDALVSFGLAGGIAPTLQAGTLVLATNVIAKNGAFEPSHVWRESLRRLLPADILVSEGPIVGVDTVVFSPGAKRQLHERTGAIACDMETQALARVATEMGVPFVVVRAISDPAWQGVPQGILPCLTREGGIDYLGLTLALVRRPWALPALIVLAGSSKKAFISLRRVADAAGSGLGFTSGL